MLAMVLRSATVTNATDNKAGTITNKLSIIDIINVKLTIGKSY